MSTRPRECEVCGRRIEIGLVCDSCRERQMSAPKKRQLIIQLSGDENEDDVIIGNVCSLVRQGYTSGYQPTWEIKETSA